MPRKKKSDAVAAAEPKIPKELLDQFDHRSDHAGRVRVDLPGLEKGHHRARHERRDGRALGLQARGGAQACSQTNQRNGTSGKTVLTDDGPVDIAKFWLKVFNDLRSRGVNDILIAVVDGLKGLADAITTTFPQTTVQTCIVHLIRSSLDYASWKERKAIAAALRPIYAAATLESAQEALEDFTSSPWGQKYPTVVQSWKRAWEQVIPFFAFPPEVRRIIVSARSSTACPADVRSAGVCRFLNRWRATCRSKKHVPSGSTSGWNICTDGRQRADHWRPTRRNTGWRRGRYITGAMY